MSHNSDLANFLDEIHKTGIELIRYLYIDMDGVIRGSSATKDCWPTDISKGVSYSVAMPFFSSLDCVVPGSAYGVVGEIKAMPDIDSFRVIPYDRNTGLMLCDFVDMPNYATSRQCPRSYLKKAVDLTGCKVNLAFENEFYLLKKNAAGQYVPEDDSLCFAAKGMNSMHDVIMEIIDGLRKQNIPVERYYPEYGPGQQEIVVKYDTALRAADNQVVYRQTVGDISRKFGLQASFMPKPFQHLSGCGCHIHLSLWDQDSNLFASDSSSEELSDRLRYFIGGILRHVNAICAFTAPTVNSYKRLQPGCWSSAYACYGTENKEACIRIIGTGSANIHFEFKASDPTCNPYLAAAALLFAGMDGLKRNIDPKEEILVDPNVLSKEERKKRGIRRLPENLNEAIRCLKEDQLFIDNFGSVFLDEYAKLKYFAWNEYLNQVTDWEKDNYLTIF